MLTGRTKVTMQYPEQKWDSHLPDHYRGAPALVKDERGRVRCVACQLCEFICPPRAIKIVPGEIPLGERFAKVEKYPEEFDIDMIRCIYCGMCEEVCPEQAIFLRKDYAITGLHPGRNGARQGETDRTRRHAPWLGLEMEREEMKTRKAKCGMRNMPRRSRPPCFIPHSAFRIPHCPDVARSSFGSFPP